MENKIRFLINFAFWATLSFLIYLTFTILLKSALPIIFAIIVAVAVQKPAKKLSNRIKIKKELWAALLGVAVYLLIVLLLVLGIYYFVTVSKVFFKDFSEITQNISDIFSRVQSKFSSVLSGVSPEISQKAETLFSNTLEQFLGEVGSAVTTLLTTFATSMPMLIFNLVISLVACSYIAKDYERLLKFFKNLFGAKVYENAAKIKGILTGSVFKILKGYLKLALITFVILAVGFLILGMNYWVLLALLISFVDLLPVLGTGTVLIPWAIIDLILGKFGLGFAILGLYIVITVLRNFLEPKIIAGQLGLHPLFMLIAIFLGLKLFGFLGLFILPITLVIIYEFYREPNTN